MPLSDTRARQSSHSGTNAFGDDLTGMQWIEAIINISAFAGFIGVANFGHKNSGRKNN
jgi:hypothetical protein